MQSQPGGPGNRGGAGLNPGGPARPLRGRARAGSAQGSQGTRESGAEEPGEPEPEGRPSPGAREPTTVSAPGRRAQFPRARALPGCRGTTRSRGLGDAGGGRRTARAAGRLSHRPPPPPLPRRPQLDPDRGLAACGPQALGIPGGGPHALCQPTRELGTGERRGGPLAWLSRGVQLPGASGSCSETALFCHQSPKQTSSLLAEMSSLTISNRGPTFSLPLLALISGERANPAQLSAQERKLGSGKKFTMQ